MTSLPVVNEEKFNALISTSDQPVLVDFGAVWCHPCKTLEPLVEKLAAEYAAKMQVVKVDIDNDTNLAVQYGVLSVPSLILFVQGKPAGQVTGLRPYDKLVEFVKPHTG